MSDVIKHERGRYKPVCCDRPLPDDEWPYHGHPTTPYDREFGIKNPKSKRHMFIRCDNIFHDIESQLSMLAKARREKDGSENELFNSAATTYNAEFCRWINTHIGKAKEKMQTFVLEQYKNTDMNCIKNREEIDIELLMPNWWDDTIFEQLTNAVHNYIVNAVLQEFLTLVLTSKDPVTIDKEKFAADELFNIKKLSNASKPGRIRKPLKPF